MMNTPATSKKQQKKFPAKKGLRNVFAQPYEKYWPVLDKDEESCLEELLNRLLPGLKRESNAIPWAQLRKMEKEERLAAQKKARLETQTKENINLKAVTMGVNAVTRGLEKNNLCSVLLDSTVESLLVKHVVVMAQNRTIPILLVPFLKKMTLEYIGFASAAMGFKKNVTDSDHYFHQVHKEIIKCSPPITSAQKVLLNETTEVTEKSSSEDEKMSVDDENSPPRPPFTISTNVYKYRSTKKERIFVPPETVENIADNKEEWSDFIAIGNDETEIDVSKVEIPRKKQRYMNIHAKVDEKISHNAPESDEFIAFGANDKISPQSSKSQSKIKSTTYLPLKVKRIQGNNNRLKATKPPKQRAKKSLNKG